MMDLSVIICAYNSENIISKTLEHLSTQVIQGFRCEIIFVDNQSSDSTLSIAESVWNDYGNPYNLRFVSEKKIGLSYARSAGIRLAQGKILVFCDDDNLFNNDYLLNTIELFQTNTKMGAIGPGVIIPIDQDNAELKDPWKQFFQYKVNYDYLSFGGPKHGWKNMPAGTGLCLRKDVAVLWSKKIDMGIYRSTGRQGNSLGAGEDTQLVMEALKLGYDVGLSCKLALKHLTIERKLKRKYIERMYFGVNSCAPTLVEAWLELHNRYVNEKHRNILIIFLRHTLKYKHRAFRIGKFKRSKIQK